MIGVWALPLNHATCFKRYVAACGLGSRNGDPRRGTDEGELGLWQRRFWEHRIRDQADSARHADYRHHNPVPPYRAGGGIETPAMN